MGTPGVEANERERRDPAFKYAHAQVDETAFGTRKYQRGARARKSGTQWALTCVDISQCEHIKGAAMGVDIRFLPFNKRSCNEIHEIAKTRC